MGIFNVQVDSEDVEGTTLLKNQQVPRDQDGSVFLTPLVNSLSQKGFNTDNCRLQYWSDSDQAWVLVGCTPLQPDVKISMQELNAQNLIKIKLHPVNAAPNSNRAAKRNYVQMTSLPDGPMTAQA